MESESAWLDGVQGVLVAGAGAESELFEHTQLHATKTNEAARVHPTWPFSEAGAVTRSFAVAVLGQHPAGRLAALGARPTKNHAQCLRRLCLKQSTPGRTPFAARLSGRNPENESTQGPSNEAEHVDVVASNHRSQPWAKQISGPGSRAHGLLGPGPV